MKHEVIIYHPDGTVEHRLATPEEASAQEQALARIRVEHEQRLAQKAEIEATRIAARNKLLALGLTEAELEALGK